MQKKIGKLKLFPNILFGRFQWNPSIPEQHITTDESFLQRKGFHVSNRTYVPKDYGMA